MMCHVAYKNIAEFGGHRHYDSVDIMVLAH